MMGPVSAVGPRPMEAASRVDALLEVARQRISPRVAPEGLSAVVEAGALLVDIRPSEQRTRDGELPGAVVIDRNVLEWRLDPSSPHRCPEAAGLTADSPIVLVCNEGFASSLAAATLRDLGLAGATDLDGGYQAWRSSRGRRDHEVRPQERDRPAP